MPTYTVSIDGKRYRIKGGDTPPSEADAREAIARFSEKPAKTEVAQASPGILSRVADAMPNIGGMVGSYVGGTGGAMLGGAAGEGYKSLLSHAAEIPGAVKDVAGDLLSHPTETLGGFARGAGEGVERAGANAAIQGASNLLAEKVVAPVARFAYRAAMRPGKALMTKYGPGVVDLAYDNRVMPTHGGFEKALGLMKASKAEQRAMESAFDAAGKQIPTATSDIVDTALRPMLQKAVAEQGAIGSSEAGARMIEEAGKRVAASNPSQLSAVQLGALKRVADNVSDPAFRAAERTGQMIPDASEAGIAKALSKGYRKVLNSTLGDAYANQGLKTKTLYGVAKAAENVANSPHTASWLGSGTLGLAAGLSSALRGDNKSLEKGLGTFLAARAMMSPAVEAGTLLALKPAVQYGIRGIDTAFGSPLQQALEAELLKRRTPQP